MRTDAIGLNVGAIHALYTLHCLQARDSDPAAIGAAREALRHALPGVRRTAATALPRSTENGAAILKANLLDDADGQVRFAALLALAEFPELPRAGAAIRAAISKPDFVADRWTVDAAKIAAAVHGKDFLEGISSADIASARAIASATWRNLIPDGDFKSVPAAGGLPAGWSFMNRRGTIDAAIVEQGRNSRRALELGVIPDVMKYSKTELRLRAGQRARLVFKNNDHMQHNVLILRPGTIEAVGALADQMLTDSQALAKNLCPPQVTCCSPRRS